MVGRANVGTGEFAHEWAYLLRDLCEQRGVVVPDPGTDHGRAVVAALGARYETPPALPKETKEKRER
jgi:hypothetical protein